MSSEESLGLVCSVTLCVTTVIYCAYSEPQSTATHSLSSGSIRATMLNSIECDMSPKAAPEFDDSVRRHRT